MYGYPVMSLQKTLRVIQMISFARKRSLTFMSLEMLKRNLEFNLM